MNSDQSFMLEQTGSAQRKALGVGIVCLALCLIELVIHPTQFLRSYLFGEVFWLGIGLSCMGILMLHHLVSGRWGFVLRRPLEAAAKTLCWMAGFFIPVIIGMHHLYIWSRPAEVAADPIIQQKTFYLNTPFFIVRQIVDWVMSLEPHFFSTIYGMMFTVTEAVGGMAFITIVAYLLSQQEPMSEVIQ